MDGLYLYCIRLNIEEKPEVTETITGEGQVYTIPYQDIEAVVSGVDMEAWSSEEIQKKAQEDLQWIKEKAQRHEGVIEQVMGQGTAVIPMKFGTLFQDRERLLGSLQQQYEGYKVKLNGLEGKQEWAVKVYLNRKAFEKIVRATNPYVKKKEHDLGIASLPEGMAYFKEKQLDEVIAKVAENTIPQYQTMFLEKLTAYAEACAKGKLLGKELTGKSLPMILNAAMLVKDPYTEPFKAEVYTLQQEFNQKGFYFECSGPWPPYNFV